LPDVSTVYRFLDFLNFIFLDRVSAKVVPQVLDLQEGDLAKFDCQAGGVNARGKWSLMHQKKFSSRVRIIGSLLVIPSVKNEDSGTYVCKADSLTGSAYHYGELFVTVRKSK